ITIAMAVITVVATPTPATRELSLPTIAAGPNTTGTARERWKEEPGKEAGPDGSLNFHHPVF
ncbi:MAG: hypothetical protein ACLFNN_03505, partial [Candidatus Paceibacterota bacterium]